jgi:hypothetical protein
MKICGKSAIKEKVMRPNAFRTELSQLPDAVSELSDDTLIRYARGDFPKVVKWMMRYPTLLRALANDAEEEIQAAADLCLNERLTNGNRATHIQRTS